MIRSLLFTAALLVPGLAYGQNPSASFTDQVVPAASDPIACDVGTPYIGSIPAPAQAAGFTHCVANYDFTQTGSFASGGYTYQWTNLSSWLQCAGALSPLLFEHNYGNPSNCNDISITTDGGTQVLQMIYTPSDTNGQTWLATDSSSGYPNSVGIRTHTGFYVEEVWRQTPASFNTCQSYMPGCLEFAFWSIQVQGGCPGCFDLEFDFLETYGNGSGGGNGVSGGGSATGASVCFSCISGYDRTQYNTYGGLNTVANGGSPNYENCWIINEVSPSVGCGTAMVDITSINNTTIEFYPMQVGPMAAGGNNSKCPGGTCSPTGVLTALIQRMTIWSCAGYSTNTVGSPCYTSGLVSY
jgi:hypothetical protein